ncbi:MAG: hypothetical protein K0S04_2281 [Herbinix sp.]|jgi:hypothetical protein|nr:hypothetical protein [Herbinix sp.]
MNIGILSMQRVCNYGSFLQAHALKSILEQRDHEVGFVDIDNKDFVVVKESKLQKIIKHLDRYLIKRIQYSEKNKELAQLFYREQKNILNLTDDFMNADHYDAVVIGSDEIFVCDPVGPWGISVQRFGKIEGVPNVLSYAASCGYTGISDTPEDKVAEIKEGLQKMAGLSVRDQNTYEFVRMMIGKNPEIHLDPVLIYSFENEIVQGENMGQPQFPYMIVYAYHNRINSKEEIYEIKKYAKEHGLKTICVGGSLPWCDMFDVIHPFQVLSYFKHAECIVTDTFHGSIIAAKFKKKFAVMIRNTNKNKLGYLLNKLDMEDRSIEDIKQLKNILDTPCDFEKCNAVITEGTAHAMNYFKDCGL